MDWLNYHHLHYFWMIAREGTIARACEKLRLAQPTLSGQIRLLENSLGEKLFTRKGRKLELTDVGRVVFRYAEEIFTLGRELTDTLRGRPTGRPLRLFVGVADVVPKLIAYRLLAPAFSIGEPVQVVCREDKPDRLLADLSLHHLDLVLSDSPVTASVRGKAFTHTLGGCGVTLFSSLEIASSLRRGFPASLDGAPFLLPADNTMLRRGLDHWFETHQIHPLVVGEFEDSALMKAFGQAGKGIFAGPTAIEREIRQQYAVSVVGRADGVKEHFYAITVERKLKHPAVLAISQTAREKLFAQQLT